ncbi:MAG: hypothetical protein GY757_27210, partial [bacterium]|nr:hypothetical protein [bacterium]
MKDTVKNYPSLRVENLDGLYLGTTVLESAGYNSLSLSKPISPTLQTALDKKQLKPGLLNYMSVCLPFKRIYTHGDCGITQIARDTVNKDNGPVLQPMPEDVPGNIEHMPDNRQLMEKETAPGYNNYFPKQLLIASVDREFDTVSLDLLLADCEIRDDGFQAYLFAGETLPQGLIRRHHINILPVTWADYLDSPEFRVYYNQRLKRLFKEFHHWPRIDGFAGRKKESLTLHKALQRFSRLQVCGAVGVGKTALLAKLADELQHDRKIIWIHADSPFISKSEVLLSTAMQMDLISSPGILEKENLKNFFSLLEGEIETHLNAGEFLVIFDSLDPFLNQGRHLLENKELQELLTRWATGTGTTGRMKLVFTADIRIKDSENEPFKNLKSQLGRAVSNEEQKIFLKPMDDDNRLELFRLWLRPFADKQKFRQVVNRLYKIGGNNLRMLRLLAIWVRKVRDVKVIEEKSSALEECRVWEKEDLIYGYIFGAISQRKQVILKTLEWIGRPVQREVICSAAGMTEALEQLLEERLVIRDGKNDTYELVYRFGRTRERGTSEFSKKAAENAVVSAIHTLRRLGDIAGRDSARAVDYYYGGNKMCERTGKWWKWKGAPVINLSGFLSWAQVLVKQSKKPKVSPGDKQEMALRAIHLCQKSIEAGIETDNSLFVYAQAMSIAYPNSHEDEIRQLYEKSIAIRQRVDKHGRFAIFLNNRLKDYEAAELQFKKARELEAENKRFNISGLYSQAELYLHCQGHEKKAGDILNRVIRKKENRYHNSFLAARLFQVQELRFMTVFFFETCNEIEPQGIRALNSYANACVQWQDKDKAKLLFEEALKIAPKHIPTYNSFANACVLWQDKDKAKQLFEEALKIAAIHVPSLNSSANDYVHWQDNDETKQLFEALKRNSQKVFRDIRESFIWKILDSYSNACVQWQEQDKAIHLLDTSLKIDPQSVLRVVIEFCAWEILDSYANACVQWQDKDKAKLFFEES